MSKYVVLGNGLIANALKKKLGNDWHWFPTKDTETIFYMGGVTHMDFEKSPDWHMKQQLYEFAMLLKYCGKHKIHLIYPSSALVYEKQTEFARTKLAMEKHAMKHDFTLGVRIFPVYGPGENKTVISKWCREIKEGKSPEVFGDGTQKRNFVYVDDVADYLIDFAKNKTTGLIDLGTDSSPSFNVILDMINNVLGTDIRPTYVPAPADYSDGIESKKPLPVKTTLYQGIKNICEAL